MLLPTSPIYHFALIHFHHLPSSPLRLSRPSSLIRIPLLPSFLHLLSVPLPVISKLIHFIKTIFTNYYIYYSYYIHFRFKDLVKNNI